MTEVIHKLRPRLSRRAVWSVVAVLMLGSCVDNDYDLSDIDTTIGVTVTDLVVPVNLDSMTLEAMLDLDDDSRVQNINGEYAIVQSGSFCSDPVNIAAFTARRVDVEPIVDNVDIDVTTDMTLTGSIAVGASQLIATGSLCSGTKTAIDLSASAVDGSIVAIDHVSVEPTALNVTLAFTGLTSQVDELYLEGVQVQLIKGLDVTLTNGSYDAQTGILTIDDMPTTNHTATFALQVTGLSSTSGMTLSDDRVFSLHQDIYIVGGNVAVYAGNVASKYYNTDGTLNIGSLLSSLPSQVQFTCTPSLDAATATAFTGQMKYSIESIDIAPVELTGIPDVLDQTGTDLQLTNPQIYLQLTNPVVDYGLYASSGLTLTSHTDATTADYALDQAVVIDAADNKFCLSPSQPATYFAGTVDTDGTEQTVDFADSEHTPFTTLGNVLSGQSLPETIDIAATDAQIPCQQVTAFPLGSDIDRVDGMYVFYAPLQLTAESKVVYTDTFDGWNDEDVDAITITKLVVNADLTSDVPLNLDLVVYPIDVDGNKMADGNGGYVRGTTSTTVSYGIDQPIEVTVSGTVTHLDGIILEARATGVSSSAEPLQPTQTIVCKNVKATVSGTYVKEL